MPREEFLIALNVALSIASWGTFGGGMCMGYAIFQVLHIAHARRIRREMKQLPIDIEVIESLIKVKGLDAYKMLHQMEKAGLN